MALRCLLMSFISLFTKDALAQSLKNLSIGDKIPSAKIQSFINQQPQHFSTDDLRGKLVILDFWDVWCSACIEAFPKMEKLQEKFKDRLKIILVTTNDQEKLDKLFKRIKRPGLSMVISDTLFSSWFPYNSVPHHVWIDPKGKIRHITYGYYATEDNIEAVLNNSQELLFSFKQEQADFDADARLISEGGGRLLKYTIGYSIAMSRIGESGTSNYSFNSDTVSGRYGFKFTNISLLTIYKIAFGKSILYEGSEFARDNRLIFLTKRNQDFVVPENTQMIPDWYEKNLFCYESQWTCRNAEEAFEFLQQDVNRLFPYDVSVSVEELPCYSLVRKDSSILFDDGKMEFNYTDTLLIIKNHPVSSLSLMLDQLPIFDEIPVIDETGLEKVSVVLKGPFNDVKKIRSELEGFGLDLQLGLHKIRMLIIRDKKPTGITEK